MKCFSSHGGGIQSRFVLAGFSVVAAIVLITAVATAQTNFEANTTNSNSPATNQPTAGQLAEKFRVDCIENRRLICGKILKVLPDGLVVDSGYTDLLRPELSTSWLVPGSVTASRPANTLEKREPGAVCVGIVFISDLPKMRDVVTQPKQYDYVVQLGYPAGEYTYTSVGSVQKTVRRFSADVGKAVKLKQAAAEKSGEPSLPK